MKDLKKINDFLKEAQTYYLATIDDNKPRVRPFGTINLFQDKLYIQTGKSKDVYKQIIANPNVEICAFHNGEWLRLSGRLINDDNYEAKKDMLDNYPSLKDMYDPNDDNTAVLYFEDISGGIYSFTKEPELF